METYAVVDRHGFTPLCADPLPKAVLARVNQLAAYEELVVQGILERDLRLIFQALCNHPFTRSVGSARALFKGMLDRERDVMDCPTLAKTKFSRLGSGRRDPGD